MRVPDACEGHGCAEPVESLIIESWEITGRVLCEDCANADFDRRAERAWDADEPDESQAEANSDNARPSEDE